MNFAISVLLILFTAPAFAETVGQRPITEKMPFQSSEHLEFISAEKNPEIAFLESPLLKGRILRHESSSEALQSIDFYSLRDENRIELDSKFCLDKIREILGPFEDDGRVVERSQVFHARFGKACEIAIRATAPEIIAKEQIFLVGFIHGRLRAFGANLRHPATEAETQELRRFLKLIK